MLGRYLVAAPKINHTRLNNVAAFTHINSNDFTNKNWQIADLGHNKRTLQALLAGFFIETIFTNRLCGLSSPCPCRRAYRLVRGYVLP